MGLDTSAFNIENVQAFVAESTKNVTISMVTALMQGLAEKQTVKALAEKNIHPNLDQELVGASEKIKMVYGKLFAASDEFIKSNSQAILVPTLSMINTVTANPDASRQFLGSFVLNETIELVKKIEDQEPKALENKEIWA